MHSASEIKILIKYLDLENKGDLGHKQNCVHNKTVLILPSASRWQQYYSLHKYSEACFCDGGQQSVQLLFWRRQLEAKERISVVHLANSAQGIRILLFSI